MTRRVEEIRERLKALDEARHAYEEGRDESGVITSRHPAWFLPEYAKEALWRKAEGDLCYLLAELERAERELRDANEKLRAVETAAHRLDEMGDKCLREMDDDAADRLVIGARHWERKQAAKAMLMAIGAVDITGKQIASYARSPDQAGGTAVVDAGEG